MRPTLRLLTRLDSAVPADPLLALRRAIATELAVMAFEAKRDRRARQPDHQSDRQSHGGGAG